MVKQINLTEALEKARQEEQAAMARQAQPVGGGDERPIKPAQLEASSNNQNDHRIMPIVATGGAEPTSELVEQPLASLAPG